MNTEHDPGMIQDNFFTNNRSCPGKKNELQHPMASEVSFSKIQLNPLWLTKKQDNELFAEE
jgi:hypothetical protein